MTIRFGMLKIPINNRNKNFNKMNMLKRISLKSLAIIASVAFLASCTEPKKGDEKHNPVEGTWVIVAVDGMEIGTAGEQPIVTFEGDGSINGTLGCNTWNATAIVDSLGAGNISIKTVGTTKKLCPDMVVENTVLRTVGKIEKYEIASITEEEDEAGEGGVFLQMFNKEGRIVMVAKKLGDNTPVDAMVALRGEWIVYQIGDEQVTTDQTLPFIIDPSTESVNGHTGSNSYGGTVVLKGSHGITFPAIALTQAMGSDEENAREKALMDAINNTTAWKESGDGRIHFVDKLGKTMFVVER